MGSVEDAMLVEVVGDSWILPANPVERRTHFLSNLDLIYDSNIFYAQIVFLFRAGIAPDEIPSTMESLKASASKLLDVFPVLAGRLHKAEEFNRTEVDVNNRGIPFYEARAKCRLGDWAELRHCDIDLKLNPKNEGIKDMFDAPLIRLQATVFEDGGIALGFSAMHMLVDGAALIDFMKSWGEIHRGVPVSRPPNFAMELLKARDPPKVTMLPENLSFFEHDTGLVFEAVATAKKKLARHTFKMDAEAVDELVKEVQNGPHKYGRVTSYEAISAFFWTSITRARGIEGASTTHFTIPVILTRRGRFDPELPDGYFGNAVVMTLATSTTDKITGEHISYVAKIIHDKAQSYVPELGKSVIDQLEVRLRQGKSMGISIGEGPPSGKDVLSTSLTGFPVYNVEFKWGKLDQVIFSFPLDIAEGLICTLPVSEGGRGRHVAICLREDHMQKLVEDPFFSKYCKY